MLIPRQIKGFGWKPSMPDIKDHNYELVHPVVLPKSVDLRTHCPKVYDQADLGSCTANALAAAYQFDLMKQGTKNFMPSRLFIYYNERFIEGSVDYDSGAQLKDGMKALHDVGTCDEFEYPYDINKFTDKPPQSCFTIANRHKITNYKKINNSTLYMMQQVLAKGLPFVFGFTVYESFDSPQVADNGRLYMPASSEQVIGGHAVLAVGYDDAERVVIVRNSWGSKWGMQGYFTIPYEYITNVNLASDCWVINSVP